MAASTELTKVAIDHIYSKTKTKIKSNEKERRPSLFLLDHMYSNSSTRKTPTKATTEKRKRDASTPTGATPKQPAKVGVLTEGKRHILWTSEEKKFFEKYVNSTPRIEETVHQYWQKCAEALNIHFPEHCRNGHACKGLAQRLFLSPGSEMLSTTMDYGEVKEAGCSVLPSTADIGTQTTLSLPVNCAWDDGRKPGDMVFIEPKKELEESASSAAKEVHKVAVKRLRHYPSLTNTEQANLIDSFSTGTSREVARAIMSSSLADEIQTLIINDTEIDARDSANKGSALYCKNYINMVEFKWNDIVLELIEKQSFLAEVLLAVALPTGKVGNTQATESLVPVLGTIFGMLMKQRFQALSAVQKIVSVTLASEQTHQKVYDRLQPLGVSLSHQGMLDTMSTISGSFNIDLIKTIQNGKKFRIVGDNINFFVGVAQERKSTGKVGHMQHWFGSAAIVQNISFPELPDTEPQLDLRQFPTGRFIPDEQEWDSLNHSFSVQASRVMVEFFPWLKFAKTSINNLTDDTLVGLNEKNNVIPLSILHKNEQKYAEVVDILDSYQELCESTYEAAEKPLGKVHIGGDQLTRERFSGARKLRAAALTGRERLDTLGPITFELFHLQMTVLQTFYQILYDTKNTDIFTLHSQKLRLLRKDADGNDVKNHYDSCRELAVSVIKAYIVEAACEHFCLPDTDTVPDNIPDHQAMSSDELREWLVDQVSPMISKFTESSQNVMNGNIDQSTNTDVVNCYGNVLVEIGLIYLELCDIVKAPSRTRLLTLMKYLMLVLKGHNSRSKYSLEILRFLSQQLALLSERAASEVVYGLLVNTGKTFIPADLQMEHLVRVTKGHLRSMCSNATDKSLAKRSSAFYGMDEVSKNFDKETGLISRSQKHKRLSSTEDEKKIIADLRIIRPFLAIPGRQTESFKKKSKSPVSKLCMVDFLKWIEMYKQKFYFEL